MHSRHSNVLFASAHKEADKKYDLRDVGTAVALR